VPHLRPRRRGWAARTAKVIAASFVAPIVILYLASWVFLLSIHLDAHAATPLTIVRYGYYYRDRHDVWRRIELSLGGTVGVAAGAMGLALIPRRRSLHGDARFARRAEIKAAGLLGSEGIIVGRLGKRLIRLAGQQGVALAAPPRAGKGTGIVIPNALTWPGSLVCVDIKRENWAITAGARARAGQICYLFDPFAEDGRTARWNPFSYVSPDPERRLNDLQRIAEMLYPDPTSGDPFWTASARSLFLGIALYLFETPSLPATIGEVLRQGMASDNEGFGEHWKRLIAGRNAGERPLSPECVRALYDVIDLAPTTASSIRKTFTSRLDLWLNPILDAATSASDFDLRELRSKRMSIYVGVNPDDLHRLRPVLNLFFQQAIGLQTRELPERNPKLKYQVMMLLDEFTALGRIPIIAEAISYLPGYNVRVVLVIQSLAQLREVYGMHNAEVMLKSLAVRIVFAPKDFSDAREISDDLGFMTVRSRSVSRPVGLSFEKHGGRGQSQTISDQRRALLLPQEVKELGPEEALVFYEGLRPIRCSKVRYFEDRRFHRHLLPPPVVPLPGVARPRNVIRAVQDSGAQPRPTMNAGRATQPDEVAQETEVIRDGVPEDVAHLETLEAPDFAERIPEPVPPEHEGFGTHDEWAVQTKQWFEDLRRERGEINGR
jgi:type IV secretion system protein VirD4